VTLNDHEWPFRRKFSFARYVWSMMEHGFRSLATIGAAMRQEEAIASSSCNCIVSSVKYSLNTSPKCSTLRSNNKKKFCGGGLSPSPVPIILIGKPYFLRYLPKMCLMIWKVVCRSVEEQLFDLLRVGFAIDHHSCTGAYRNGDHGFSWQPWQVYRNLASCRAAAW